MDISQGPYGYPQMLGGGDPRAMNFRGGGRGGYKKRPRPGPAAIGGGPSFSGGPVASWKPPGPGVMPPAAGWGGAGEGQGGMRPPGPGVMPPVSGGGGLGEGVTGRGQEYLGPPVRAGEGVGMDRYGLPPVPVGSAAERGMTMQPPAVLPGPGGEWVDAGYGVGPLDQYGRQRRPFDFSY